MTAFDAIVLAGGDGRRLGGVDKALLDVGNVTLLDRALAATQAARTTIVVGPPHSAAGERVIVTREQPPGGGPAAAIAHGLSFVASPTIVVVAVDAPFAASAIDRLLAALPGHEAAMLVDDGGRRQPLLAAYLTAALRERVGAGPWAHRAARELVDGLDVNEVTAVGAEALDCDTAEDLSRARELGLDLG